MRTGGALFLVCLFVCCLAEFDCRVACFAVEVSVGEVEVFEVEGVNASSECDLCGIGANGFEMARNRY